MVAIHTSEDIIRALREDPDLLDQVRRAVMTDDVLALPGQFAEMLDTQNRILADLAETRQTQAEMLETQNKILADLADTRQTQAEMLETQNKILADLADTRHTLAETRQTQNSMLETQNRILADLAETRQTLAYTQQTVSEMLDIQNRILADLDDTRRTVAEMLHTQNGILASQEETRRNTKALHRMYRRQHDDLDNFRGNYSYNAAKKNSLEIAHLFVGLYGLRRARCRVLTEDELGDMLDKNVEAVEELGLRDRAWRTFENADVIAAVTERNSVEPRFYISIEASYTGDMEDVLRATDHAKILRRSTGLDAYAVVTSVRLTPGIEGSVFYDVSEFLDANDEDVPLWYRLGESEPDLPPPR